MFENFINSFKGDSKFRQKTYFVVGASIGIIFLIWIVITVNTIPRTNQESRDTKQTQNITEISTTRQVKSEDYQITNLVKKTNRAIYSGSDPVFNSNGDIFYVAEDFNLYKNDQKLSEVQFLRSCA